MRIVIACVGRLKAGPVKELVADYGRRLPWSIDWREVEEKRSLPPEKLKEREADLLLGALPEGMPFLALDERGKTPDSRTFANLIQTLGTDAGGTLGFVIGGADGLSQAVLNQAAATVSFGRLTWPHMLVRAMLAEQLYRAQSILAGHPYHRD